MSLVLRFVDVREESLGFLHCKSGLSGKALSETLLGAISELKLEINDCIGQGYTGLLQFLEVKNGMTTHIMKWDGNCKIQSVSNIMEQIKEVSYFSNFSEPRQLLLLECIELVAPDGDKKMNNICRTRWIEQVNDMDTYEELFIPIVYCLEKTKFNKDNKYNRDTSVKASYFSY